MTIVKFKHDELFRKALENPNAAREFLELYLPQDVKSIVDLSTLKLENDTFIDKKLRKRICDALFSVKFNNEDGYIFCLAEHQSTCDHWIALRLLKYMTNIWERYLTLNPEANTIPIIYTLVYYNGQEPYTAPRSLWDLFTHPSLSRRIFEAGYKLINLQEIPDEKIRQNLWAGMLGFFMKHARKRNLLKLWEETADRLPDLVRIQGGNDYIELFLSYTLTHMEENDIIELENLLTTKTGDDKVASVAQKWFDDGVERGVEKGIEKTAINMLKKGFDIKLITEVTGLSMLEIQKLKAKL